MFFCLLVEGGRGCQIGPRISPPDLALAAARVARLGGETQAQSGNPGGGPSARTATVDIAAGLSYPPMSKRRSKRLRLT